MKALIPAAGYGTRFFPATKCVPKELLPVGNKPAIQWIVEEAVEAGAEEVVIVTSPEKQILRDYFSESALWHTRLAKKEEAMRELARIEELSRKIRFVDQLEQRGLGHAVLQAAPLLRDEKEPILILLGDALVGGHPSASAEMAALSLRCANASVVGLELVPEEKVSRYGIIAGVPSAEDGRTFGITDIVEKPKREEAPSNLAVAGRYLLSPRVFELLETQQPGVGGEIQLTDAIQKLLGFEPVYGYLYPGKRFDIGNPQGYLICLQEFEVGSGF